MLLHAGVEDDFYTRFPNSWLRLYNAGATQSVAWRRFDTDATSYKPDKSSTAY